MFDLNGAGDWIRTRDLLITNQLLYQLSYTSRTVEIVLDRVVIRNFSAIKKGLILLRPSWYMAPGDVLLSHGETPHYHRR